MGVICVGNDVWVGSVEREVGIREYWALSILKLRSKT